MILVVVVWARLMGQSLMSWCPSQVFFVVAVGVGVDGVVEEGVVMCQVWVRFWQLGVAQ